MARHNPRFATALAWTLVQIGACAIPCVAAEPILIEPRPLLAGAPVQGWEFNANAEGWRQGDGVTATAGRGVLTLVGSTEDPKVISPPLAVKGPLILKIRARVAGAGSGEVFWTTTAAPEWNPQRSRGFRLQHDEQWHEYQVLIDSDEQITGVRVDPGSAVGKVEIDWVRLSAGRLYPYGVHSLEQDGNQLRLRIHNYESRAGSVEVNGQKVALPGGASSAVTLPTSGDRPFDVLPVSVKAAGLPDQVLPVCLYRDDVKAQWIRRTAGDVALDVSPDGAGARVFLRGEQVTILAPLVRLGMKIPTMQCVDPNAEVLVFNGDGVTLQVRATADGARVKIDSQQMVEGPVLRAAGQLRQGLLAGIEYLGKGERSSSKLDIETDAHFRVRPDPMSVTMPLMACVTDRVAAAMSWSDMTLQPVYATPNFLDGTADHRMALQGKSFEVTARVTPTQPLESVILWGLAEHGGLPALPASPPRTEAQQRELLLKAFNESLAGKGGWGHAAEARWERRPYGDIASAIGRLSGNWPQVSSLLTDGAHIRNDAAFFMAGQTSQWLGSRGAEVRKLLAEQQPDGSFRYSGKFARGHHEDTASGYCAWRASLLLDFARITGDPDALAGGLRCLEFMKKFRTPRGAQTHELPLHTPDLLGSAYLVWAYARGHELTGNADYLNEARRWAISGVPFVYLWGDRPTMRYATIPALGATQWVEPNWIGLPVQWCGLVYGYALTMIAPHDKMLDWNHLARGILITAEQMQYPDGPMAGCFPDFYLLREQRRGGPSVNPGAIVSLQLALAGEPDALCVATGAGHRVASPFPVTIDGNVARVSAKAGVAYEVLIDGERIVGVKSVGIDEIPLR